MNGWIQLHRKLLENPIFLKPDLLQLFIYCLLKANHEPTRMIFNSKEITIERGQFITGRDVLSRELKQNGRTTYDRLRLLESLEILTIKTNNKFSLITVANYGFYQTKEEKPTAKPTTSQQPANTNNNDNNYNKNMSDFFEKIWTLYPRKEGKGKISDAKKKELFKLGNEIVRAVERYNGKLKREGTDLKYVQMGSTFFNSGYVDYLDANYKEQEIKQSNLQNLYRRA